MLLVDTSIWIDHLRRGDEEFARRLRADEVLIHPFVIGEIALGHLHGRLAVLDALQGMYHAEVADHDEVMTFIEVQALSGTGIGYIDAHLLASAKLTPGTVLWTRDKRLREVATRLDIAADLG